MRVIPNDFGSDFINDPEQRPLYQFMTTHELSLDSIRLTAFVQPADVSVRVGDDTHDGTVFPIVLKADQTVQIGMSFASDAVGATDAVMTTLVFGFTTADGVAHQSGYPINFDPVSPMPTGDLTKLDRLIDSLLAG